ncbi:uncharacterized protein LOC127139123 isoform X2 [Lates calcarifer]|uniref:Uncharacterized protein LOC127139123 isoform X2 n=1 Tax=Lates calcarifer TaxID=8187 RepID=A0AAJ8DKC2_LATCA|nr:uncharacterized protein LOC127139123 isoform X2 [Lates calcarifer]
MFFDVNPIGDPCSELTSSFKFPIITLLWLFFFKYGPQIPIVYVTDFAFIYSVGRILNRFSKDISQIDSMLPITFVDFYQNVASVIPLIPVIHLLVLEAFLPLHISSLQLGVQSSPTSHHLSRMMLIRKAPAAVSHTGEKAPAAVSHTAVHAPEGPVHSSPQTKRRVGRTPPDPPVAPSHREVPFATGRLFTPVCWQLRDANQLPEELLLTLQRNAYPTTLPEAGALGEAHTQPFNQLVGKDSNWNHHREKRQT